MPAMKNGTLIQEGLANIKPTNKGLMAAPVVRATPVIPAAAERSSARTTAIVYDCLVGTSIWLILKRTRRTKTASLSALFNKYDNVLFAVLPSPCYACFGRALICHEKARTRSSLPNKSEGSWNGGPINIRYHILLWRGPR